MTTALTYKDRDNSFSITFLRNNVTLTEEEMTAITKIELKFAGQFFNSVDHSSGFVRDNESGKVEIKPHELGMDTGRDTAVEIIIYDGGENQNGLVWGKFSWVHSGDAKGV